jgi:hypothetical protein
MQSFLENWWKQEVQGMIRGLVFAPLLKTFHMKNNKEVASSQNDQVYFFE